MSQSNKYQPVILLFRQFKLTGAGWECGLKNLLSEQLAVFRIYEKMISVFKRRRSNKAVTKHKIKVDNSLGSCLTV